MIATGELAVRFAAALLPRASRARYREQWLGELRDAAELGIRTSDIAVGSLAFAATFDRALPSLGHVTPDRVRSRSRLAAGLTLGAALVALTRYADVDGSYDLTDIVAYDYFLFVGSTLLLIYGILAVTFSLALVTWTRDTSTRIRAGVWLLSVASISPVVQKLIDGRSDNVINVYLSPGSAAYLIACVAVFAAGVLLRKEFHPLTPVSTDFRRRTLVMSGLGGLMVLLIAALCMNDAIEVWAARSPLIFGGEIDSALYREWAGLKTEGESAVTDVFFAWGALCVTAGCAVAVGGVWRQSTVKGLVVRLVAALTVVLITYATVVDFLNLMTASIEPTVPTEPMMLLSRWFIIAVSLITVGGVRLTRHADHLTNGRWNRPSRTVSLLPVE